jgi:signal transduction histidine kinase
MRERAGLAGGTLHVRSRPGAGTTIELCLQGDVT